MQYLHEIIFLMNDDRRKLPWLILLFIFASILDLLGLGLIGPYINIVLDPTKISNNLLGEILIQNDFLKGSNHILLLFGIALVVVFLFKALMAIFISWIIQRFIMIRQIKMTTYLMNTYQQLPYSEYVNRNSSEYIHTIIMRVGSYLGGVLQPLMKMMSEGIIGIAILILLGWTNGPALVLLVMLISITSSIYLFLLGIKLNYLVRIPILVIDVWFGNQEGIEGLKEVRILV